MLISQSVHCPYCGEPNDIEIDPSGGRSQSYEEDCQVCCRPWQVKVRVMSADDDQVNLFTLDDTILDD